MARTATLCPGGISPLTITPSSGNSAPETNCRRAMTTSSSRWMRMVALAMSVVDERRVPGVDRLPLLAEAIDAEADFVAGLQEHRGLAAHADTGGSARADEVARIQRHEAADVAHQRGHAEDHGARAAVLAALAVHVEPHAQSLRIGHLVARDEPWPDRSEGVAALALVPLPAAFELVFAFGQVVDDAVARHVLQG